MLMLTSKFLEYQRFIVLHNDPIHLWNSSVASEHHRHLNLILAQLALHLQNRSQSVFSYKLV